MIHPKEKLCALRIASHAIGERNSDKFFSLQELLLRACSGLLTGVVYRQIAPDVRLHDYKRFYGIPVSIQLPLQDSTVHIPGNTSSRHLVSRPKSSRT
jgi:hypothetical protein